MAKKINQFDLDEVYRQVRTNIEFSRMDENIQVINTVSTNPNEGKSTIASNLARICADKYRNVLLIDCDIRNSSLHRMFKTSNATGLEAACINMGIDTSAPQNVQVTMEEGQLVVRFDFGEGVTYVTTVDPNSFEATSSYSI